ncbi:hypothetical protein [Pelosinus sp. sgz500959]|uniref:hypothetical protein n=1 Tax=Pelosinus sp. sgz500959 TaxID=3242472 RepID=UPI00366BFEB8
MPNILLIKKGSVSTDTKELQILKSFHHKIEQNAFDEKDIYSFLNLIKKFAKKNTPMFELGDFIAQREKHRGYIHTYLLDVKAKLDKSVKEKVALAVEPVYSFDEIGHDINDIMALYKLSTFKDEIIGGIILCIISLLHDVKILNKKEQIGKLVFSIQNDQIVLLGVMHGKNKIDVFFPIIETKNIFCKIGNQNNEPILFNDGVKIKNVHNKLIVNFN